MKYKQCLWRKDHQERLRWVEDTSILVLVKAEIRKDTENRQREQVGPKNDERMSILIIIFFPRK